LGILSFKLIDLLKEIKELLFKDLNLIAPIQKAIQTEGYNKPTPIQEKAIPSIIAGRDLLGIAQTGTGKTAAFAIPILQNLSRERKGARNNDNIKALVLAPTRELADQIGERFKAYGQYLTLKTMVVFGGVSQETQTDALIGGVDILIATPGRLIDLISQGYVILKDVEMFVLDEADRMLDMGMEYDVQKIIDQLPKKRQNMLFSATMPQGVSLIAGSILKTPVKIDVSSTSPTAKTIRESVYFVEENDKIALLIHLLKSRSITSALVFTRTKQRAEKVTNALKDEGVKADSIHGDKSQHVRQMVLDSFKDKKLRVLVATDVAARGIDIEELSHVINFDLPNISETHVHRIGRTGRAGMKGASISFCNHQEKRYLKAIEELTASPMQVIKDHPYSIMDLALEWSKKTVKKPEKHQVRKQGQKADTRRDGKKVFGKQPSKQGRGTGKTYR
jgi:ATP-dependent RNA helicase RhlE